MSPSDMILKPIIVGCVGAELTTEERALFSNHKPIGLILFRRNCISKTQVTKLISEFKSVIGFDTAPILIDQEGGTVARLKSPEWREFRPAVDFANLAERNLNKAKEAVYWNAVLMGMELIEMGVTVNCAPVMDIPTTECHGFLADSRTYGDNVEQVTALAIEVCKGLISSGVTPVMKHIPGHGRGSVDSHKSLPIVSAKALELQNFDYEPFRKLSNMNMGKSLWAMLAHIIYEDVDSEHAATVSKKIVSDVIRNEIGFDGVTIADDIGMEALGGSLSQRARATLASGLDITLHCSGIMSEMRNILEVLPKITDIALERVVYTEKMRIYNMQDNPLEGQTVASILKRIESSLK